MENYKMDNSFYLNQQDIKQQSCSADGKYENRHTTFNIRTSAGHLPLQRFLTWLSGCPLPGQVAVFKRPPVTQIADTIGLFLVLMAVGVILIESAKPIAFIGLPLIWLVATGRARKAFITIAHQAVHAQLITVKRKRAREFLNLAVGEVIGVLFWVPSPDKYFQSHVRSHHKLRELATPLDKDGISLFRLGFLPGKSKREYWVLLATHLANPLFYIKETFVRMRLRLLSSGPLQRLASWLFLTSLLGTAYIYNGWQALILVYCVPVFIGFSLSGLMQGLGEHGWGVKMESVGKNERVLKVSQGRFLFDAFPQASNRLAQLKWWSRLFAYHLPARIAILNGDVQHHDWHHCDPRSLRWTESAYARADNIEQFAADQNGIATHSWSLVESLERSFDAMSKAPSLTKHWKDLLDKNNQVYVI
ncbi:MAG: hypothetical protein ACI9WC_003489 [Arenicella sp.]|jgi:hypothetical protein